MRFFVLLIACNATPYSDVVGPFPGEPRRYAVDQLLLPPDPYSFGDDLDGDGKLDNQLGNIMAMLIADDNAVLDSYDQLASGALEPVLEIAGGGDRAGVRIEGVDGAGGDFVGGRFGGGGAFVSNRTRLTSVPAAMTVRLPIFVDVDPVDAPLTGVQIDLEPDGDGFWGTVRGGVLQRNASALMVHGVKEMLRNNPDNHLPLRKLLDSDGDQQVSEAEISDNAILKNVIYPKADLFDAGGNWRPLAGGPDALGVGFRFHAVPCAQGSCIATPPRDYCRDRATDADETDHDCGGTTCSLRCAVGRSCQVDGDCMSNHCLSGVCR